MRAGSQITKAIEQSNTHARAQNKQTLFVSVVVTRLQTQTKQANKQEQQKPTLTYANKQTHKIGK